MRHVDIDADLAEMAHDAEYQREAAQIMAEFASSDAETARMIDDELAELARLAGANEAQ